MVCVKTPLPFHTYSREKIARKYTRSTKRHKKRKMNVTFGPQQNADSNLHDDSTWLSPTEYRLIRREVELSIILREQMPGCDKNLLSSRFCSRGLEDFCYARNSLATCLKPKVLLRRRTVIRSVLDEQESMRRRRRNNLWEGVDHRDESDALRSATRVRINHENTMEAIKRGLNDAHDARMVYQE